MKSIPVSIMYLIACFFVFFVAACVALIARYFFIFGLLIFVEVSLASYLIIWFEEKCADE